LKSYEPQSETRKRTIGIDGGGQVGSVELDLGVALLIEQGLNLVLVDNGLAQQVEEVLNRGLELLVVLLLDLLRVLIRLGVVVDLRVLLLLLGTGRIAH